MEKHSQADGKAVLGFGGESQARLELKQVDTGKIDRGTAFGRIAFSCPREQVRPTSTNMF